MKHVKMFDSSILADGLILDTPFIVTIEDIENNTRINLHRSNLENDLYGIFINDDDYTFKSNVVPNIPMIYLFYVMLYGYPSSPLYNQQFHEKVINSYAGQYIDYGIIKWPHNEMIYNIQDIDDFFDSIDNNGVAHKNNIFRHSVWDESDLSYFFQTYFNFDETDVAYIILNNVLNLINSYLTNLPNIMRAGLYHFNFYKDNKYLYDFNSNQSMTFYDNITSCVTAHPEFNNIILQIYPVINNIDPVKYIFVLKMNENGQTLCVHVFGYIANNDAYFSFIAP